MKNKVIKIAMIFSVLFMININNFVVFAATTIDEVITDGDSFIRDGSKSQVINMEGLKDFSGDVYNLVFAIGLVIAVIVGSVLGIKFMISSIEEKAKIKEILIVYGMGCAVLFGAFTIWKVTIEILGNV